MFRAGDRSWQDAADGRLHRLSAPRARLNNFFVLAPNLTIYDKLITDFTQNTPKYVFKGISEFAVAPP